MQLFPTREQPHWGARLLSAVAAPRSTSQDPTPWGHHPPRPAPQVRAASPSRLSTCHHRCHHRPGPQHISCRCQGRPPERREWTASPPACWGQRGLALAVRVSSGSALPHSAAGSRRQTWEPRPRLGHAPPRVSPRTAPCVLGCGGQRRPPQTRPACLSLLPGPPLSSIFAPWALGPLGAHTLPSQAASFKGRPTMCQVRAGMEAVMLAQG